MQILLNSLTYRLYFALLQIFYSINLFGLAVAAKLSEQSFFFIIKFDQKSTPALTKIMPKKCFKNNSLRQRTNVPSRIQEFGEKIAY